MFQQNDPIWNYLRGEEIAAFSEIQAWANKPPTVLDKALAVVAKPLEAVYRQVPAPLMRAVSNTLEGTLRMLCDGAGFTVSESLVLGKLKGVKRLEEIREMDIRALDRHATWIIQSHAAGCAGVGGGAGVAGLPGLVVDIPGLYTVLFRMVLELGFLYGFDSHSPFERRQALQTLASGHDTGKVAKEGVLCEAARVQGMLAKGATWKELEQSVLVVAIQQLAEKLGIRLVKRKMAQALLVIGALVGAAGNYGLASDVGFAAYQSYRLRFLHRRATMRRDPGW